MRANYIKTTVISISLMLAGCTLQAQDDIEVVNIMHPALQAYMADSTYFHNDDIDVSVIAQYADSNRYGPHLDWPQGKLVTWARPAADIAEITVSLSEKADYTDALTYQPTPTDTAYTIYNLIPGRTYYYKVEARRIDKSIVVLTSGIFRTEGQVRMMRIEGADNVRDIGGWMTQFGVPIRYGKLYRSGHLDNVSEASYHDFVENHKLGAELDLRGLFKTEPHLSRSPLGSKIKFTRVMSDSYALESQRKQYVRSLRWIIFQMRQEKVVDWHCGVGCDRCGTLSFLIEGVLGVSEADLCRDYELSCFRGHKRPRGHVGFRKLLPFIKQQGPADDLAQCFYNYWLDSGMTITELNYLRKEMLGL